MQRLTGKNHNPIGSNEGRVQPARLLQCHPVQHPGLQLASQPPDINSLTLIDKKPFQIYNTVHILHASKGSEPTRKAGCHQPCHSLAH